VPWYGKGEGRISDSGIDQRAWYEVHATKAEIGLQLAGWQLGTPATSLVTWSLPFAARTLKSKWS
jgi:hypothetical protein